MGGGGPAPSWLGRSMVGLRHRRSSAVEAVQNVFALALKRDPQIEKFNPLTLWDLRYVREIDDSGYIDKLYQ